MPPYQYSPRRCPKLDTLFQDKFDYCFLECNHYFLWSGLSAQQFFQLHHAAGSCSACGSPRHLDLFHACSCQVRFLPSCTYVSKFLFLYLQAGLCLCWISACFGAVSHELTQIKLHWICLSLLNSILLGIPAAPQLWVIHTSPLSNYSDNL